MNVLLTGVLVRKAWRCGMARTLALAVTATLWAVLNTGAQPANDAFAHRAVLSGSAVAVSGSLSYAGSELDEPFINEVSSGQTAWWSWTAPEKGLVTLSAEATKFTPLLAVYTGDALGALSLTASNNYVSCYSYGCGCHWGLRSPIWFHVDKGETYQIGVDSAVLTSARMNWLTPGGVNPLTNGTPGQRPVIWTTNVLAGAGYKLRLDLAPQPANDDFNDAIILQGKRTHLWVSNAGASKEPGEPCRPGDPGGSSVWFTWQAPASGQVMVATNDPPLYRPPTSTANGIFWNLNPVVIGSCGTETELSPVSFYPVFGVYTGASVDALSPVGALPVELPAYSNAVCFDAVKGQVYRIAFDGNQGTTGTIPLCLALTPPATNDRFERRIGLRSIFATARGYNAGATAQAGDPPPPPASIGKTVWWSWRAPVSGPVSIKLTGSDLAFPLQVFTGTRLSTLTLVGLGTGTVTFEAVEGAMYQIAVSDAAGQTGGIWLTLNGPEVPLELKRVCNLGRRAALLEFFSQPGEMVLLQHSSNGTNWDNVRVITVRRTMAYFLVSPAPSSNGPFYRAIILDRRAW